MKIQLWADGSGVACDVTTNGQPGGWAFKLLAIDEEGVVLREISGSGGATWTSSNRMELMAVIQGLDVLAKPTRLTVYSDSQYVTKAFTEDYMTRWIARDWRKVKNADLWKVLKVQVDLHDAAFVWVPGHTGVKHNEDCDKRAGRARRTVIEALASGSIASCGIPVLDERRRAAA